MITVDHVEEITSHRLRRGCVCRSCVRSWWALIRNRRQVHWSALDHLRRLLDDLRCLLDNLPLHSLDLGNFNNLFNVLNVWDVNFPDLLLNNDFWNMPNDFALLNWAWHVDMPVNN